MLESTNKKSQVAAQMEAAMATNSTSVCDVGGNDTLKTVDLPPRVQTTGRLLFTESRRLWVDDEDSTPMSIDRVDRHHRPPHAISIVSGGGEKHEDDKKNQEEDVAMLGGGADDCIPNVEEQQPFDEVKGNDSTSMEDVDVLEKKEHNDDVAETADKHEEDVVQENQEEESDDPNQPPMLDESSEEVEEEGIEVDNSLLDIPTTTTTAATPKQKEPRGFALLKLKARKKTISSSTDQGEKKSKNKVIGMRHRVRMFGARDQSKKVFASVEQPPLAEVDVDLYPADTPSSSVLASIIIGTSPDVEDQIMYKEDIKDGNNPTDTPTTTTTNQSSVMLELFPSPSHISTATSSSNVVSQTESPNNNSKAAVTSVGDQLPPSMPSIIVAKKEEDHDMEDDEHVETASVLGSEETKDEYHQDRVHEDEDHEDGGDHKDEEVQDQKNGEKSDESALSVVTESLSLSAEDIAGGRIVCIEDEQGVIDTSTDVVDVSSTLQGDINDVEVIKCLGFDDIDYQLKEDSEANINENVKEEVSADVFDNLSSVSADVFDNLSSGQDHQIKTDAMEVSSSTLKETKKTRKQHRLSKILKPKSQFGPIAGLSSEAKEVLKASLRPIIIAPVRKKPAPTTANKVGLSAEAQAIIASDTDPSRKAQYVEDAKADDDVQEVEVEKISQRQNTITTSKKQKQVPVMIIQQKRTIDSSYADSYESQYDVSTFGDTLTYNSDDSFVSKMSDNGRCNFGRPCGLGIPQDELVGDLMEAYNDTKYHMQQIIGIWGGGLTERQRSSSGRRSSRRTTAASDSERSARRMEV